MLLLIVDKELKWANYMRRILEKEGHRVKMETDYERALDHASLDNFDMIFLDLNAFKKDPAFVFKLMCSGLNSRVIVMTNLPNYRDAVYTSRYGAIDYIDKVYDSGKITDLLKRNIVSTPVSKYYLKRVLKEEGCP